MNSKRVGPIYFLFRKSLKTLFCKISTVFGLLEFILEVRVCDVNDKYEWEVVVWDDLYGDEICFKMEDYRYFNVLASYWS